MIAGLLVDPEDKHYLTEYSWCPHRKPKTTYARERQASHTKRAP